MRCHAARTRIPFWSTSGDSRRESGQGNRRAYAARYAMLSEPMSGATAGQLGVAAFVVGEDQVENVADNLAIKLANGPTRSYGAIRALLKAWSGGRRARCRLADPRPHHGPAHRRKTPGKGERHAQKPSLVAKNRLRSFFSANEPSTKPIARKIPMNTLSYERGTRFPELIDQNHWRFIRRDRQQNGRPRCGSQPA